MGVSALSFAAGAAATGTISTSLITAGLVGAFVGLGIGLTSRELIDFLKDYKKIHVNFKTGDIVLEQ
ncbi:MAG: hypothetical protein IAA16_07690 [Candidatus Treponema excrementipullorum]|uniref:Uncharacterized protein n=1 Tax=Candidatus Treponema excrementipullorum TaxID=2838768 RepID=A0A9E2NZU1_9SPIR|nr:hypothetical protein [Candidatus Treponema excrementipullorum]